MGKQNKRILVGILTLVMVFVNTMLMVSSPLGKAGNDALIFVAVIALNYIFILAFSYYVFRYVDNPADSKSLFLSVTTLLPVIVIVLKLLFYINA